MEFNMNNFLVREKINNMSKQKVNSWDYVCPFTNMSESDWEKYKNLGDNFSEFPSYVTITKEKIELILQKFQQNEYDFVGMYTNNSNNTVFKKYNEICGWTQITTFLFVEKRSKTFVEFVMYECFTAFPKPDKESKCEIIYDITINQEVRYNYKKNILFSYLSHPRLYGGLQSHCPTKVSYRFYSKVNDPVQDPLDILTRDFFSDIKSKELYKYGEKVEKMSSLKTFLMCQFHIIHRFFNHRIEYDLIKKLNNNILIKERFNNIEDYLCIYDGRFYRFFTNQLPLNIGDNLELNPEINKYLQQSFIEEIKARERANLSHITNI